MSIQLPVPCASVRTHEPLAADEAGPATSERRAGWVHYRAVPHRIAVLTDVLAPVAAGATS